LITDLVLITKDSRKELITMPVVDLIEYYDDINFKLERLKRYQERGN